VLHVVDPSLDTIGRYQLARLHTPDLHDEVSSTYGLTAISFCQCSSYLQIGLQVLRVSPKDRCDNQIEALKIITEANTFFLNMKEKYGEFTYNQMVRCCYLE
jgi:hypothetical protein